MRAETAVRALFLILFALTLYLMYLIFRPFLPGIAWAVVLVVACHPIYERLVRWLRGRQWAAAILLAALAAAFIVLPAVLIVFKVGQGLVQAYNWLEARQAAGELQMDRLTALPWVVSLMEWVGQYVDLSAIDLPGMALSALKNLGNAIAGKTRALVANAVGTVLTLVVLLVTMTVLFHEGHRLVQAVRRFLPLGEADKEEVFKELRDVARAVFFGVLLTALVQAILGAVGFAIVGLPAVVTFGTAIFFCALLPGGPVLVWGPAAVWLFLAGHPVKGFILLAWGALVVSTVDNLLRPVFIGRGVRMHMLLVFFGIFGGMLAFGLIGLFAGPLIITLFLFLLEVVRRDFFPRGVADAGGAGVG